MGSNLLDKPEIQTAINELLEMKGYGREFRVEKLGQHMSSPDPVVSLKALDLGFKLSDDYPAQRNINSNVTGINFTIYDLETLKPVGQDEIVEPPLNDD
jgi:hypothetical protein